jgi:hypothetical protein
MTVLYGLFSRNEYRKYFHNEENLKKYDILVAINTKL